MPRTTIDLDAAILRELKRRRRSQGRTLGQLASELLAKALREEATEPGDEPGFRWTSQRMDVRVDLEDKEAVRRALEAG